MRRLPLWRRVVGIALILGIATLTVAAGRVEAAPQRHHALTTIKFALNNNNLSAGLAWVWDGVYLGYYQKEGINLQVVTTGGPTDSIRRIEAGEVNVIVPPAASVLDAAARGQDLGLISPYLARPHGQYTFAVPKDSPIKSISDLAGKKIGVSTLDDEGAVFAQYAMTQIGHKRSDVQLVPVNRGAQAATELKLGHVDALALPTVAYALIGSMNIIPLRFITPDWESQIMGNMLWMRRSFVNQHPQLVDHFLRAFTKSLAFFIANPRAAVEISFKMFPQTLPAGMSLDAAVKQVVPQVFSNLDTFRIGGKGRTCKKFGCFDPSAWDLYLKFLGLSKSDIGSLDNFYTNKFVASANDQNLRAVENQARHFLLHG